MSDSYYHEDNPDDAELLLKRNSRKDDAEISLGTYTGKLKFENYMAWVYNPAPSLSFQFPQAYVYTVPLEPHPWYELTPMQMSFQRRVFPGGTATDNDSGHGPPDNNYYPAETTFDASTTHARVWLAIKEPHKKDITRTFLLCRYRKDLTLGVNTEREFLPGSRSIIMTIPAGKIHSDPFDFLPEEAGFLVPEAEASAQLPEDAPEEHNIEENFEYGAILLPVEIAPDVLAVNSDFDEGRIDPATGYAIPDCDDPNIALEAQRDHLDGKFSVNERITDDLHPGFFGVSPSQLDDAFWDGANVTIRKVGKTDPSTGHPESGHIRLYGKWGDGPSEYRTIIPYNFDTLATTNLADGGINGAPGESVYGSASAFPAGTSYFIEGVHPGKITLEWRYQKGSVDFKHEQEFEVYTKKTASQWRFDLDYKIRLETLNDPSGEIRTIEYPLFSDGYEANIERAAEFYDFYRECFHEPLRSHATGYPHPISWPGLARLAGSQVIGGLSDSEWGRRALLPGAVIASPILTVLTPFLQGWTEDQIEQLQVALFQGAWQIFTSVGWQHHAFRSSGYEAIEWVATETDDVEAPLMLSAWGDLRQGILDHDKPLIDRAALKITDREQNHTIVPTWTTISGLGLPLVDEMFSVLGKNSCSPAGLNFTDLFDVAYLPRSTPPKPLGNLANAGNRWTWINYRTTPGGILDTWETETLARKLSLSGDSLKSDAERFSIFSGPSSPVPVLSWDHLDVP